MRFEKYEGLGNDFLLVETTDEGAVSPAFAARLCERRRGIGADGVLLVLPARQSDGDVRMRVINADGSIPEMCGNGVRCVAVFVARSRGMRGGTVRVETDAGERACSVEDERGEGMVTVDMGPVRVFEERTLQVDDGRLVTLTPADVGNPHAVLFGTFAPEEMEHLGPVIAKHRDFPLGTNVEFARVSSAGIELTVWERGVGMTLACGTGACATVAVACSKKLMARGRVPVHLPGGILEVTVDDRGLASMRGPTRRVFGGEADEPTSLAVLN